MNFKIIKINYKKRRVNHNFPVTSVEKRLETNFIQLRTSFSSLSIFVDKF
jgi:hypothetical protein